MIRLLPAAGIFLLCLTACGERGGKPSAAGQRTAEAASRVTDRPDARKPADRLKARLREARSEEDPGTRDLRLVEIAWETIELEPALAREALAMISPGADGLAPLAAHIAMRMAEEDADAAILWADGLESPARDAAISKISVAVAAEDPPRGATLAAEMLPPGRDQDLAVVGVIQRWAVQDAPAAAAWLTAFGPGEARVAGARELLGAWGRREPAAALSWAESLPEGDLRKEAAAACAAFLTSLPPVDSAGLLAGVEAGFRREIEAYPGLKSPSSGPVVFPTRSNSEN